MSELVQCRVPPRIEDWVPVLVDPDLPPMPCRSGKFELHHGEVIVVETPDGKFLGTVTAFSPPSFKQPRKNAARIIRRATAEDEKRHQDTGHLEKEIEKYVRERTHELKLDLHPFKVRLPLSGRKAVIYFSAEKRVDYRPLQRDLGRRYRRRIEMRSLGVRDGARLCGGLLLTLDRQVDQSQIALRSEGLALRRLLTCVTNDPAGCHIHTQSQ